jgi:hypothetical protein
VRKKQIERKLFTMKTKILFSRKSLQFTLTHLSLAPILAVVVLAFAGCGKKAEDKTPNTTSMIEAPAPNANATPATVLESRGACDFRFVQGSNLLVANWVADRGQTNKYGEVVVIDAATASAEEIEVKLSFLNILAEPEAVFIEPNYILFRSVDAIHCVDVLAKKATWKFDFTETEDSPEDASSIKGPIKDTIFAFIRGSTSSTDRDKKIAPAIYTLNLQTGASEKLLTLSKDFEPSSGGVASLLDTADSAITRPSEWYLLNIQGMEPVLVIDYKPRGEASLVEFHSAVDGRLLWKKSWPELLGAVGVSNTNEWLGRFTALGGNALLIGPSVLAAVSPKTGDVIRHVPNLQLASPLLSIGELKYSAFPGDVSRAEYLKSRLSDGTLKMLTASENRDQDNPWTPEKEKALRQALLKDLNAIIQGEPLHKKEAFAEYSEAEQFLAANLGSNNVARLNRLLLEMAYENNFSKALTFEFSAVQSNRVFVTMQHPNIEDKRLGIWLDESLKPLSAVALSPGDGVVAGQPINSADAPFVNNLFQ